MKKKIFKESVNSLLIVCLFLLAMGISTIAQAQTQEENRKFYLSLGVSGLVINNASFGGGGIAFGFMPSPKNLLTFEINGGTGASEHIGSYSYTITTTQNGQQINHETKTDGKISYDYSFYEAVLAWHWVFNMSDKWRFRVGPCIGLLTISGGDSYSPTSYQGTTINGIPDTQSISKSAPMAGAVAGITWSFAKRWFLDLNYRLSYNTEVKFPERTLSILGENVPIESKSFGSIGNRINLAVGWRF